MKISATSFYSPRFLLAGGGVGLLLLSGSADFTLWAAAFLALPLAVWLLGRRVPHPVLPWIIAMFWLAVMGDLILAQASGAPISATGSASYRENAIFFSLAGMLAIALGMRCGTGLGGRIFAAAAKSATRATGTVSHTRAVQAYFASLLLTLLADRMAQLLPSLAQPFLALSLLRFACIYLVACKTFEENRGGGWLLLIALLEIGAGAIAAFSSYKEAFFIILIAMAASRRKISLFQFAMGAAGIILIIWMSLIWTVIKQAYRAVDFGLTTQQKIEWIWKAYSGSSDIDYSAAFQLLSNRVGYTKYFAATMGRMDQGPLPHVYDFYGGAIQHILTPRILFPDKPVLDDSKITSEILDIQIDQDTSVGLGYVTQAYVDFGFPGLLLPIWLIGALLGLAVQYFLSRPVPVILRGALTTSLMFTAFAYAADIDKAFGSFVTQLIVMAFVLKFGYPFLASWLAGRSSLAVLAPGTV